MSFVVDKLKTGNLEQANHIISRIIYCPVLRREIAYTSRNLPPLRKLKVGDWIIDTFLPFVTPKRYILTRQ